MAERNADTQTWTVQVDFHVEEQTGGGPFIVVDQKHVPDLPQFREGFLQLDLKPGTSRRDAEALCDLLNRRVISLAYTRE